MERLDLPSLARLACGPPNQPLLRLASLDAGASPRTPLKYQDSCGGHRPPCVCTALCMHRFVYAPPYLRTAKPPLADGGWRVTDGSWWVTDGGWRVKDGVGRVSDGGGWVSDGGWRVTDGVGWATDGGWRVTDGGWRVIDGSLGVIKGGRGVADGVGGVPDGSWRVAVSILFCQCDGGTPHPLFFPSGRPCPVISASVAHRQPPSVICPPLSATRQPPSVACQTAIC